MSKGKRYDADSKLNIKKVIAVLVAIAVVIMFIVGIKTLLTKDINEDKTVVAKYYTVYTNGKYGVIDQNGKVIIEPTMDEMITIPDNKTDLFICTYNVNYDNGTYSTKVLNSKNKEQFTKYDLVEALDNYDNNKNIVYEDNVLKVRKDGKYGLIDFSGKEILQAQYDEISVLQGVQNSIIVKKDDKLGLVDTKGNLIIDVEYSQISGIENDYKNGYIVKNSDEKYGLIDFNKVKILDTKYEEIKPVKSNDIYVVKEDGKLKVIKADGQTVIENKFDDVKQINNEQIVYVKNNRYGIMNTNGESIVKNTYDDLKYIFGNYYIAKKSEKYGVINTENTVIVPLENVEVSYVKQANLVLVNKDEESQTKVLDSEFNQKLEGFISELNTDKGYFRIRVNDEYKYYNFKIEEKKPSEILSNNTLFLDKKDGKYGYIDSNSNVVVDYIYDDAQEQNENGFAAVKKDGKWGSIDKTGKIVVETKYDLSNNIIVDFIGKWHIGQDTNCMYYTDK